MTAPSPLPRRAVGKQVFTHPKRVGWSRCPQASYQRTAFLAALLVLTVRRTRSDSESNRCGGSGHLPASSSFLGSSARRGGLGWFILENKNSLDIASVFAGLLTVILLGLLVENVIFGAVERRTVQRWGMQT
jgi:hypothetical protein